MTDSCRFWETPRTEQSLGSVIGVIGLSDHFSKQKVSIDEVIWNLWLLLRFERWGVILRINGFEMVLVCFPFNQETSWDSLVLDTQVLILLLQSPLLTVYNLKLKN